jgi:ribosomal protein L22
MSPAKGQGSDPQKGGVVPEEAVEEIAADARDATGQDAAEETHGATGARTPTPDVPADAKVGRRARRARRARAGAEAEEGTPAAAGGAGSKRAEAQRGGTDSGDVDQTQEERGRAEDAEDDASADTEEERPRRSARRRAAETTTGSGRRPARRRTPEEAVSVRAQAKYVRCAPRKARLVIDHIRGKSVDDARAIMLTPPRAASRDVLKLLDSCVANAENNHELSADELRVAKAYVDEGPTLKRYRPRALGRATRIRKRTSHMTIYLTNQEGR